MVSYNLIFLAKQGGSACKITMVKCDLDLQFHLRYHGLLSQNKNCMKHCFVKWSIRISFLNSGLKVRGL